MLDVAIFPSFRARTMVLYQILLYVIRVRCPNRPVRAPSDNGWFLLGIPAPCRAGHCAPTLQGSCLRSATRRRGAVVTQTSARWRMPLGASADVKDQPASPQPSPRPDGEEKIHFDFRPIKVAAKLTTVAPTKNIAAFSQPNAAHAIAPANAANVKTKAKRIPHFTDRLYSS